MRLNDGHPHSLADDGSCRVYFAQVRDDGPIKIGVTRSPERRVVQLQEQCPYPVELLCAVRGGALSERVIHAMHTEFHIRGEWFEPNDGMRKIIAHAVAHGVLPPEVTEKVEAIIRDRKALEALRASSTPELELVEDNNW